MDISVKEHLVTIVLLGMLVLLLSGCGSKRNPTGGEQDTVKPVVLASSPAEFADISSGVIEISFSKPMDRNSLANSIYIYPPVQNKKISLDGPSLKIKLNEPLKQDTNYFVTLSTRLKDIRGNALDQNQTLVFTCGALQTNRIAGIVSYEEQGDKGLPLELSLFSADSLLVYSKRSSEPVVIIDNLNPGKHLLRTYIDKNLNGRYDFGTEPFYEGFTQNEKVANLEVYLAYADTSKVRIQRINVISNRELKVFFSEPLAKYKALEIAGEVPLAIEHTLLDKDILSILTAPMDSIKYTFTINGATDKKDNQSDVLSMDFNGSKKNDATSPQVTYTNPRNGASVNSLTPIIEVHFSEIIPAANISAKLISGTEEIALKLLSSTGRIHRFQPTKELVNYRSHTFTILAKTKDHSNNTLQSDVVLQFLPLKR